MTSLRSGILASAVCLTAFGAAAQVAPVPPRRPPGLARETPAPEHGGAGLGENGPAGAAKVSEPGAPSIIAPSPPVRPDAPVGKPAGEPAKSFAPSSADAASPQSARSQSDACLAELAAAGVEAQKADAPPAGEAGCVVETPVRLKSAPSREGRIAIHGDPLVACATARALASYLGEIAAPLAKSTAGVALNGVTAAGFECRARNRAPGGKLSAHGKGLALDLVSFHFADATTTTVAAPAPERSAFLTGARRAACGYFTTVLGPGADEAHRDHLHLDIEAHGASGAGRICQ